tara:strand:- start:433 stop:2016 length:1584 start_codon:yes stop_codon:yes gene_type:complete
MTSTIKVDTISENTSANGVTIDGLTIKDGGITATTGAIVFNEASADLDFRVESNGNANCLHVDGGNSSVGINTTGASDATLQINDTVALIKLLDTDDNSFSRVYHSAGNLLFDADKGETTAGSYMQFGVDDTQVFKMSTTEVVANDDSNDQDFRIESNGNTHMLFVDGGNDRIGFGTNAPTQHTEIVLNSTGAIPTSEAIGSSNAGVAMGLGIHNESNSATYTGIALETRTSGASRWLIANEWQSTYLGDLVFRARSGASASTERMRILSGGQISTGGETSPDVGTGGLGLNQNTNDDPILTFKSTGDIAHGMTASVDTDTYAIIKKQSATKGGIQIRSFAEDLANERFVINTQGDGDVTEATSSSTKGAICFVSSNKSGDNQSSQNANGNLMSIANYTNTRFLFEGNGEFHADASSNTFDEYEDAHLVRAFDLSHGRGVIDSKFDKFVSYNHQKLADLKLVGKEEDGTPNHFVNVTGFQRLHNGAIWQQYEKHQKLASAFYKLAEKTIGKEEADKLLTEEEIELLN